MEVASIRDSQEQLFLFQLVLNQTSDQVVRVAGFLCMCVCLVGCVVRYVVRCGIVWLVM